MPVRILKPLRHENSRGYRDTKTDAERKFYSSTAWRKTSEQHRREEPLCRQCKKEGRITLWQMTDHIHPINRGGDPFDESNLQTLCHPCHNAKRQSERGRGGSNH